MDTIWSPVVVGWNGRKEVQLEGERWCTGEKVALLNGELRGMQWTGLWSNTVGSVYSLGRYLGARTEVHATALRAGEDLSGNGTLRQWLGMV